VFDNSLSLFIKKAAVTLTFFSSKQNMHINSKKYVKMFSFLDILSIVNDIVTLLGRIAMLIIFYLAVVEITILREVHAYARQPGGKDCD
jgi:hypothetical protein